MSVCREMSWSRFNAMVKIVKEIDKLLSCRYFLLLNMFTNNISKKKNISYRIIDPEFLIQF